MLKYRDINDQFVIERNTDDSYCTVKILRYVSKEGDIYTTYTTPKEEILDTKLDIRLFKDTTYIYLDEYTTWNMECSYINGSNINEYYASKTDMETKIEQTEEKITQSATKTLEDIDTARQEAIDEANKNTAKSLENYSTKEDTDNAKKEAIDSANTNTEDKLKSYPTKIEMNSAIEQSAESIKSTVSQTYSTKTEVVQAKEEAISSANSSTDEKLEGYSTNADTEQAKKDAISSANSATDNKLKSYSTTTDSDKKYSTKAETNTAKQEAIDSANSSTDEKLQDYSTSTDTEQAKNDAIKSANDATDEKLKKYSTTTQMESAINQKADSITSSVSATYTTKEETATAKEEAISSANSSTDTKLKNYTETTKLGTVIEQNAEAIRIAWNQISQFLKLEGIDGKASLNIYDGTNNLLLTLDDDGETFYDKSGKVLGEIGLVTEYANELLNGTTLAFSVPVNDWKDDSTKMAWGLKNKEGKFLPIFYMSSFAGAEQSEYGGKLNIAGELYASSVKANLEMLLSNQASLAWYSDIENPSTNSGYIRVHASSNTHLVTGLAFGYGDDEFLVINGHDNCIGIYKPFAVSGFVGYPMIGLDANHKYYVNWHDGSYDFYVDGQYFGALSDKRLKSDFKSIDDKFLQAIDELEIQQFKIDNKCGKISWGIVAQDLIEVFKKYDINPKDYEILQEVQYKLDDDTMYYRIEYQQFLVLKQLASDRKVQKLENEIKKQNKVMQELLKRIEKLEGGKQ